MLRKRVYAKSGARSRSTSTYAKRARIGGGPSFAYPRFRTLSSATAPAIPRTFRAKLTYCEYLTINPGPGVAGTTQVSCNGIYDPNVSGVGHQPSGFDQLIAIYGEYIVVAARIKCWFRNLSSYSGGSPCLVGIYMSRSTTTSTDWREYVENGNGTYTVLDALETGNALKSLTHTCDMNKEAGHNIMDDEGYSGTSASNPAEQRYWQIVVNPFDNASDLGNIQIWCEINYDVVFRDRVRNGLS